MLAAFPGAGSLLAEFDCSFAQSDWSTRAAIAIFRSKDVSRASCSQNAGDEANFANPKFSDSCRIPFRRSGRNQAARTELRNLPTSSLRRLLSPDSDCAADSTCEEAEPVSLAPRCTSVMLDETCWVPCAACCTLREISCVAAPCSSTAAAMVEEISDSFSIVAVSVKKTFTDSCVAAWKPDIC